MIIFIGCKKNESNPVTPTVVALEEWGTIADNDSTNLGQLTFKKYSDGSVAVSGMWNHVNQGATLQSVISSGTATIADTIISITIQGTATYSGAPPGYNSSAYTESMSGSAYNGKSSGTYTITYSGYGWPSNVQGLFNATRISGTGITKR
jgi:hypothetical protein